MNPVNKLQKDVHDIIAEVLDIPLDLIHDEYGYQQDNRWTSLKHVELVAKISKHFQVFIHHADVLKITTVGSIKDFLLKQEPKNSIATENKIHRGLNNIYYDKTYIAGINGEEGKLTIRGHSIEQLVTQFTFEEAAFLIIKGENTKEKFVSFQNILFKNRQISEDVQVLIKNYAHLTPINVLLLVMPVLAEAQFRVQEKTDEVYGLISQLATVMLMHFHFNKYGNLDKFATNYESHAEYIINNLSEIKQPAEVIKIFDRDLIIHAEHGSNASAFAARVCTSTEAEGYYSIIAAITTFSGSLHGGALSKVMEMLFEIGDIKNVSTYIKNRLEKGLPIFGFGHRVYRTIDPRAKLLMQDAYQMTKITGDTKWFDILQAVEDEMVEQKQYGVNVNVDFYACISYYLMGIPIDYFVPIFILSRIVGWLAHIREQQQNNILIRPRLRYIGGEIENSDIKNGIRSKKVWLA